jgi:Chondroitinase B
MLLLSLMMTLAATVQPAVKPAAPSPATAIHTWHVAPEELKGLPRAIQLRTISAAAAKAEPGDTVMIHSGVYRETVTVEASGTKDQPIRFEATPGENVVITGADAIRNYVKGFSRGWEAGGDKLVLCRNVVIEKC